MCFTQYTYQLYLNVLSCGEYARDVSIDCGTCLLHTVAQLMPHDSCLAAVHSNDQLQTVSSRSQDISRLHASVNTVDLQMTVASYQSIILTACISECDVMPWTSQGLTTDSCCWLHCIHLT